MSFALGQENYGVKIETVKEIMGMMEVVAVPKTPAYVKGIINLRGKIVPIVDLRLKFGMEDIAYNDRTCIVVVEVANGNKIKNIGIAVDTVSEVIDIRDGEIEEFDSETANIEENFIMGIAKFKERVLMLLDIIQILTKKDIFNVNVKGN